MSLDKLTDASHYDNTPYKHLQMLCVNRDIKEWFFNYCQRTSAVKVHGGKARSDLLNLNFRNCKVAIDFSRYHLTNLDHVVFREERLPLELFVDYESQIKPLFLELREAKSQNSLNPNFKGIPARIDLNKQDGSVERVEVWVKDFDPEQQRFLVVSEEHRICTWRSRVQLALRTDPEDYNRDCMAEIRRLRAESS
jgi:hypothetical protein